MLTAFFTCSSSLAREFLWAFFCHSTNFSEIFWKKILWLDLAFWGWMEGVRNWRNHVKKYFLWQKFDTSKETKSIILLVSFKKGFDPWYKFDFNFSDWMAIIKPFGHFNYIILVCIISYLRLTVSILRIFMIKSFEAS